MKITTTGRKVTLKEAFITKVEKRLSKMEKFFSDEAQVQVTVTLEKDRQTVEITICDGSFVVRGEKTDKRMEIAFDDAIDLLQRRIIKNRKRIGDKIVRAPIEQFADDFAYEEIEDSFNVIKEKHFFLKPQTVDDAILEMQLLGHNFFMFKDASTNTIQVVYLRNDGDYGLLIAE